MKWTVRIVLTVTGLLLAGVYGGPAGIALALTAGLISGLIGAIIGGIIGGLISVSQGNDFFSGAINGIVNGFLDGFATGVFFSGLSTMAGAIAGKVSAANAAKIADNAFDVMKFDDIAIAEAKTGDPTFGTFKRRLFAAQERLHPGTFKAGTTNMIGTQKVILHHPLGRVGANLYNVVGVTQSQHLAIHAIIGYRNAIWSMVSYNLGAEYSNMNKKAIMQEFVDFVEGRMSFVAFQHNYEMNTDYKKLLDDKGPNEKFTYQKGKTINQCLFYDKWTTALGKLGVHSYIKRYLEFYEIPIKPTTVYADEHKFRQSIQPSYVSIEDEDFLNAIITSAPNGLTLAQKRKWLKEKIKSLFKYVGKPPRWIQDPEWPIVDGKPLVFKSQTKVLKNDERVWYTFYDSETGKETIIMQCY